MREGIPVKPVGKSAKWFFFRRVWDYCFGGQFPLRVKEGLGIQIDFVDGTYLFSAKPGGRRGQSGASATGMVFRGEYDSSTDYDTQNVVIYTPSGGQAGTYVAITDPPTGTSPDDAVYWVLLPYPPPGVWAF